MTIELHGRITEQGRLEIELPDGLPAGEARVTIEIPTPDWTTEEIADALKVQPLTGAEIVAAGLTGGWKHDVAESGAEWVERTRRERREKRTIPRRAKPNPPRESLRPRRESPFPPCT